ncbi:SgcJ/EcaC family oxidoreductase [Nodularia sp. UHCC 0506]|uniref:SgcJ/EcaC family oxidoreductase n=1 Tax=Nodularia sp. UHCC 0506 TaxID=3110243 RepID=UPI002B20368D|nr:SgcJ/EcaC family oxidoreductase [Nodularia sp. UHCC 0506]MEA5513066.1 SgcJ/EcaC family oxidoreductase [Nodularia sp. UHCC 0506]
MKTTITRSALSSIFSAVLACASIMPITPVQAQRNCNRATRPEIAGLFDRWNRSLQTGDPNLVTQNYARNAILLPTVSNQVRRNHEEIQDYFVKFLALQPVGKINYSSIRLYCGVAIDSGIYTFTTVNNGQTQEVQARYTFVYNRVGNQWLIAEHHSSAMPETITTSAK